MFWDTFQKLQLDPNNVKSFIDSLIGLSRKNVQVMGHVALETTCGKGEDANVIDFSYLNVDALSPNNIFLGRLTLNALEAIISSMYLILKYPFPRG